MSTLIITENQYDKLILSSVATIPKTIRVTESQYSRLLLKESEVKITKSADMSTGWSTKDGTQNVSVENYWGNPYHTVGPDQRLIHVSYWCQNYNSSGTMDYAGKSDWSKRLHGVNIFPNKSYPDNDVKKWVEKIWALGLQKQKNTQMRFIKPNMVIVDGIAEYIDKIKNGDIKFYYNSVDNMGRGTGKEYYKPNSPFLKNKIIALDSLKESARRYPIKGVCGQVSVKDTWEDYTPDFLEPFIKWVGRWDTKDWIDAAAVVLLAASFLCPPCAVVTIPLMLGLEAVNVVISGYELYECYQDPNCDTGDKWFELGIRFTCLVAGPIIGRGIGYGLKSGRKVALKIFDWATKFIKMGAKKGALAAERWLLKQGLNNETIKAVLKWAKTMGDNPKAWKKTMEESDAIIKGVKEGNKQSIKEYDKIIAKGDSKFGKAWKKGKEYFVKTETKVVNGKTVKVRTSQYIDDIYEIPGKIGMGVVLTLWLGLEGYRFTKWMEKQKFTPEQQVIIDKAISETVIPLVSKKVKIWEKVVQKKYKSRDNIMEDMKWLSENMDEGKFAKFVADVNKILGKKMDFFIKLYDKGKMEIVDMGKNKNLYITYNSFCANPGFDLSVPSDGGIIHQYTGTKKQQQQQIATDGEKFKDGDKEVSLVTVGNFKGLYVKDFLSTNKEGENWNDVTDQCKVAGPIIQNICDGYKNSSSGTDIYEFCMGVDYESLTLEKYNERLINAFENDAIDLQKSMEEELLLFI